MVFPQEWKGSSTGEDARKFHADLSTEFHPFEALLYLSDNLWGVRIFQPQMAWTKTIFTLQMPWRRSNLSLLFYSTVCFHNEQGLRAPSDYLYNSCPGQCSTEDQAGSDSHLCLIALLLLVGRELPFPGTLPCEHLPSCSACVCVCVCVCLEQPEVPGIKDSSIKPQSLIFIRIPDFLSMDLSSLYFNF